jgi:prolyl oligopeptidase
MSPTLETLRAALAPCLCLLLAGATPSATAAALPAIDTPVRPITDTYHGVTVVDPYRWLEQPADDPEVKAWTAAQNARSRAFLDAWPDTPALRARVTDILTGGKVPPRRHRALAVAGGRVFALKAEPPRQQPFIVAMPEKGGLPRPDDAKIVVDPAALDATGGTSIDWFVPSPDGRLVAVSLSAGGSETGDVHVFDVETGRDLGDTVPRVNGGTAGGALAWAPDGRRFYYTRYPRAGERPAAELNFHVQVYAHTLGTPTAEDTYELGKDFPRIAEYQLEVAPDGRVLATVQDGDSGRFALHVRDRGGRWVAVSGFDDPLVQAALGPADGLFAIARGETPRGRLVHLTVAPDAPVPALAAARTVVPEGPDTLVSDFWDPRVMLVTDRHVFLTYQLGGPSEIRVFDHRGRARPKPTQPPVGAASGLTRFGPETVLFQLTSYLDPPFWAAHDAARGKTRKTALAVRPPDGLDFADCVVVRERATSKDGTLVPVNIVHRKGLKLDGSHPALVTGYGGYAISLTPTFNALDRVLLDHGFVLAVANLRGGAEFGATWHAQGRLLQKQNVFDDFAAVVSHLQTRGYTRPDRTVIKGGSNGGLLMGAMLTQHPTLVRAVVSFVGIYDMLRTERSPNGAFNVPEYGTVADPAQFRALHAYSPYHRVVDGTRYPRVLLVTGENDTRVNPAESRKMTARLQAADPEGLVLLRTSAHAGHGQGTALREKIEEAVDTHAFILEALGLRFRAGR